MQVKPRSYPHPVLTHFGDDIVGSQFQSTIAVKGTRTTYVLDVTVKTSNGDLVNLVRDGRAHYAVHVECGSTRYRELFATQDERASFEIPAGAVDGRIEVCSFILASDDIPQYVNRGFHEDFRGLFFSVRRGDTLAVGQEWTFSAERKLDPLRKIPSIFVVVRDDDDEAPAIDIDTMGPKIRVSLSRVTYDAYAYLKQSQRLHSTLNSMVIVPALVAVLESVKAAATSPDGLANLESRRWYGVLARRLRELGVDPLSLVSHPESTPALASRLIGDPLADAVKTLKGYEEPEEEVT